jgi:hypothetical protein
MVKKSNILISQSKIKKLSAQTAYSKKTDKVNNYL